MLSYPSRSAQAQGFLRRAANDIDIYVEDAARASVWLALLRKCLPPGTRLRSVMPLGDRKSVEEACKIDQSSTRPRLYITDGDFDFLLRKGAKRLRHLYRIPATNLEAFVMSGNGILPFIASMRPELAIADIQTEASIKVERTWFSVLRLLFAVYAENERANAGSVTCSHHVSRLTSTGQNTWAPDITACKERIREVKCACIRKSGLGGTKFAALILRARTLPIEKVVSGKTYLLPIVESFVREMNAHPGNSDKTLLALIAHGGCPSMNLKRRLKAELS